MIIGVDLDSVLADFQKTFLEFVNAHNRTSYKPEDVTVYSYPDVFGVSKESAYQQVLDFYNSPEFETIPPIDGAVEAVDTLTQKNTLYIVTSRPHSTDIKTAKWVKKHFPDKFAQVIYTEQYSLKTGEGLTKATVCKQHSITLFIEDAMVYAEEIARAGIAVLLLDSPWNQQTDLLSGITRVNSWGEIVNLVGVGGIEPPTTAL